MKKVKDRNGALTLFNTLYAQVPEFTEVFDEETWYIFVACFTAATIIVVFILSRFVVLKPVE